MSGLNKISDTESTASNVRRSYRDINSVGRLETTMKVKVYIQAYRVKKIDKGT